MIAAEALRLNPRRWLVTGGAGFIGSHLIETLLRAGQRVVTLDNFATGSRRNLEDVAARVGVEAWRQHRLIEGDIVDINTCHEACRDIDVVLHQAALGSVPRSIDNPLATHAANVTGFLNMLVAARDARVLRFVYAASSAAYGDHPALPKVEAAVGRPLSPYAASKTMNEIYADVFGRCYGLSTIGLRYFNVFGARQDPNGPYAAVIPRWIAAMVEGRACLINGDGSGSRDFCYVDNAVQANLLAATVDRVEAIGQVYNVAVGARTTLLELHSLLAESMRLARPDIAVAPPQFGPLRAGDVPHSHADIGKARGLLGYTPTHDVRAGLGEALPWYLAALTSSR